MEPNTLLLLSVMSVCAFSPNSSDHNYALKAYYNRSGLEASVKRIERDQLDDEARLYIGHAIILSKTLIEKRITFQWRF